MTRSQGRLLTRGTTHPSVHIARGRNVNIFFILLSFKHLNKQILLIKSPQKVKYKIYNRKITFLSTPSTAFLLLIIYKLFIYYLFFKSK